MKKLKNEDKVLYWDGATLDLSTVVLVDKKNSQVKLDNGVMLHRSPDEDGIYHRSDYREPLEQREHKRRKGKKSSTNLPITYKTSAWLYGTGNTEKIWEIHCNKKATIDKLYELIRVMDMRSNELIDTSEERLNIMYNLIKKVNKWKN